MFLNKDFLKSYSRKPVKWGFPSGPNSLGEVTYRRTYSRGGEKYYQTVARVVEGTFEKIEEHCAARKVIFRKEWAEKHSRRMFEKIFHMKFMPPGRGLWMMGTDFVKNRTGMGLFNCAFVSTKDVHLEGSRPFRFLMDVSMLGVGCGFDTKGAGKVTWLPNPNLGEFDLVVEDSREGWVESTGAIIDWGLGRGPKPKPRYHKVRGPGLPIKGFGGTSSGPEPLTKLHEALSALILRREGNPISSRDIVDIMNLQGACVVAGNVRRTAEIALGEADDLEYLDLKNYDRFPERAAYGWTSNNSIRCKLGMDYSGPAERTRINGEPGYWWPENCQAYGRMVDPPCWRDRDSEGTNPCGEQTLFSYEVCNLVENFPEHHSSYKEWEETFYYSWLYAKAVSLFKTHWSETNEIIEKNLRVGSSLAGVTQFLSSRGVETFTDWCDRGYRAVCEHDRALSERWKVPESIKKTSVKPGGTVPLVAGATPGAHYQTFRTYVRRIRYAKNHPDVPALVEAGYHVEPALYDPNTIVVSFPVKGPETPTEKETSLEKKVELAVLLQRVWADNQVSYTATFDPKTEGHMIEPLLKKHEKGLKAISFLPMHEGGAYAQMPYEAISDEEYFSSAAKLKKVKWSDSDAHDSEDRYCDGEACLLQ